MKKRNEVIIKNKKNSLWNYIKTHKALYLMLIPGLFFLIIYKFWPLYGLEMAFKDYNIFAGNNPMDAIVMVDAKLTTTR